MSLAEAQDRLQLPESLSDQLLDFRRRVWTIKMVEAVAAAVFGLAGRLPRDVPRRPGLGDAGLGAGDPVRRGLGRRGALAAGLLPLGLAATAGSSNWPGCWPRKHPQRRRSVAGDHRAGPQRIRAGAVAGPLRGGDPRRWPRTRSGATSATPCPTRGTGSGAGWSAVPAGRCARPARRSSRRRPTNAWRAAARPLEQTRRATRSRPSSRCPTTLVVAHGEPFSIAARLRDEHGVAARARARSGSATSIPVAAPLEDGALRRSSCRRRSIPARLEVRIGDATPARARSSRPCVPS